MKKIDIYNIYRSKQCGKVSKYIYYVKKRLVWVFYNRGERDKHNEIGLKEERGIEMHRNVNYSAPFAMLAPSLFVFTYIS